MRKWVLILFVVFTCQNVAGQEFEMVRHQVQVGETVRMISRKYKIEPSEIYKLNKFAIDGISKGMVLQLMVPKKEEKSSEILPPDEPTQEIIVDNSNAAEEITEKPVAAETARKRKLTSEPAFKTIVDNQEQALANAPNISGLPESPGINVSHTVLKGETLFSLSRKYKLSVDEIRSQNSETLKRGLRPGQVLTIVARQQEISVGATAMSEKMPETKIKLEPESEAKIDRETAAETPVSLSDSTTQQTVPQEVQHTVVKGETLFSLAKRYHVGVNDIKNQNPSVLKKGLQIGQVLNIMATNQ